MFGLIVVLLGIVLVGYLIVKKYYAPWSLLLVGLILLLIVGLFTDTAIVTVKSDEQLASGYCPSCYQYFLIYISRSRSSNYGDLRICRLLG